MTRLMKCFPAVALVALLILASPASAMKFVVLSHIRSMVTDPQHRHFLTKLSVAINAEEPAYVFILGDYTWAAEEWEWEVADDFLSSLQAPLVMMPGNHEVNFRPNVLKQYVARVGYLYNTLFTDEANFIFVNSVDQIDVIRRYLESKWKEIDSTKPTILLTHHQPWTEDEVSDEKAQEKFPHFWYKPYHPSEILPLLKGHVDYVIAGDYTETYETVSMDGMVMHSVGIGSAGRDQPILYFVGEVNAATGLTMTRKDIPIAPDDPWRTSIEGFVLERSLIPKLTFYEKLRRKLYNHPVLLGFLAIAAYTLALTWLCRKVIRPR